MQVEKFMASFWRVVKEFFYIAKLNNDQYKNYAWPAEVRRKLTTSMINSPKICQLTDSKRKATTKRGPSKIVWLTMNGASNISIAVPLSFTTTRHLLNQVLNRTTVTQSHWTSNNHYTNCPAPLFIRNAFCTPGFFYCKHLLHQTTYTPTLPNQATFTTSSAYTRHHLHQTPFTPRNFYIWNFLQQATFTSNTFYTKSFTPNIFFLQAPFTTDTLCTKQHLHQGPFTPKQLLQSSFCTIAPFTDLWNHSNFYSKRLLHHNLLHQHLLFTPDTFSHQNHFYTRRLLHQTPFTPDAFSHQKHFTTDNFFTKHFLALGTISRETFAPENFYARHLFLRHTFCSRHFLQQTAFTPNAFYIKHSQLTPNTIYTRRLFSTKCLYIFKTVKGLGQSMKIENLPEFSTSDQREMTGQFPNSQAVAARG